MLILKYIPAGGSDSFLSFLHKICGPDRQYKAGYWEYWDTDLASGIAKVVDSRTASCSMFTGEYASLSDDAYVYGSTRRVNYGSQGETIISGYWRPETLAPFNNENQLYIFQIFNSVISIIFF
jgi:hypothetical protein